MPDDGSIEGATWPLPKFMFEVNFGPEFPAVAFQEVSGLDVEVPVIEYLHGDNPVFPPIKMPGIAKYSNVTLKKGIFINNNLTWKWVQEIKMNTVKRQTFIIRLLDEGGNAAMQWTLNNAWVTKITGTDIKSDGNEVAIETIGITCEQIVLVNG